VRDRVSRIVRRLPDDVDPPSVEKSDSDSSPIMWLTLSSPTLSMMELTDYMERYVIDRFAVLPGVSQIRSFGAGGPSMRIWLDRLALAARNLTVNDIEAALRSENLELPAGRIESSARNFQVRVARNYQTAEQFRRLVVAQGGDGHLIRLGEIADVEIAPRDLNRVFRTNGATTTGFGIIKQSTANTVEVLDGVGAKSRASTRICRRHAADHERRRFGLHPRGYQRRVLDDRDHDHAGRSGHFVFLGSLRAMLIPLSRYRCA
jgi:multidrug efflux pump